MNIVVIHGLTNTGKTTTQDWLRDHWGLFYENKDYLCDARCIAPIDPLKRHLEFVYDLPKGSLDTRHWKEHKPHGCEKTMQELMVSLWHFWREHDQQYATRMLGRQVERCYFDGCDALVTSLRNPEEAELLTRDMHIFDAKLYIVLLTAEDAVTESSDVHYLDILKMLRKHAKVEIQLENDKTPCFFQKLEAACSLVGLPIRPKS